MNAFEMRLQMIKIAIDYLEKPKKNQDVIDSYEKRYEHERTIFLMKLDKVDHVGGDETPKRPKQPTIKDILKLASQYNDFVSDNGLNSRPSL